LRLASCLAVVSAILAALFYNGIDVPFYTAAGVLLLAAFALAAYAQREQAALALGGAGAGIAVLWAWSALALVWTEIPYLTLLDAGHIGFALLAYASTRLLCEPQWPPVALAIGLVALGCGMAAWMIGQAWVGLQPVGPVLNPNMAAAFVNMIWPIGAAVAVFAAPSRRLFHAILAVTTFLMVATYLDGSRAAVLASIAALTVFGLSTRLARAPWRPALALLAAFVLALVLVQALNNFGLGGSGLAGRMASLEDPGNAGSTRWPIYKATAAMISERPWLGFGPGTFFQIYPEWRLPTDISAGFHAHNDYLEFWAERGLPGIALLLLIGAICVRAYGRTIAQRIDERRRAVLVAATASLATAAVHALFSFNLQILPFMGLCGIAIALIESVGGASPLVRVPFGAATTRVLPAVALIGLLLIPVAYWTAIAVADYRMEQAADRMRAAEFEAAGADWRSAQRLWRANDLPSVFHADMLRVILERVPEERTDERRRVKQQALDLLDGARERNPWRALTPTARGRLHLQPPGREPQKAERALRQALSLNPRFTNARVALTRMLEKRDDLEKARAVVEHGLDRYARQTPPMALMVAGVRLRQRTGDTAAAQRLVQRIESAREQSAQRAGEGTGRTRPTPRSAPE
jgi:O-antigen ligase